MFYLFRVVCGLEWSQTGGWAGTEVPWTQLNTSSVHTATGYQLQYTGFSEYITVTTVYTRPRGTGSSTQGSVSTLQSQCTLGHGILAQVHSAVSTLQIQCTHGHGVLAPVHRVQWVLYSYFSVHQTRGYWLQYTGFSEYITVSEVTRPRNTGPSTQDSVSTLQLKCTLDYCMQYKGFSEYITVTSVYTLPRYTCSSTQGSVST